LNGFRFYKRHYFLLQLIKRDCGILNYPEHLFSKHDKEALMSDLENPIMTKDELLIVVVQGQDADMAIESLTDKGFGVTKLPSVGGFLGRKSATLLIGVTAENSAEAVEILNRNCRKRVAFIAVPMENSPLPMPAPTPITIGGASIFSLDIDQYEEF
jgi:uncharacterized protein YaaQ